MSTLLKEKVNDHIQYIGVTFLYYLGNKLSLLLIYNPFNGEWTITEEEISDISSQVGAMSLK